MDTTQSTKIIRTYEESPIKFERKVVTISIPLETTIEEFFQLLCPVREADWIPGWTAEILYSKTGFAEDRAVFQTDETNNHGSGLWTFTGFEKNKCIKLVAVQEHVLTDIRVEVRELYPGTIEGVWTITTTALTPEGNRIMDMMPSPEERKVIFQRLLSEYLSNDRRDKTKSNRILQRFKNRTHLLERAEYQFSGSFETDVNTIFSLLCPTREADWIPGWNCRLIYTSSGYAEDKCVFTTDPNNPIGKGIWAFTDYKNNEYIEFIRCSDDVLIHCRITVEDNKDGSVTATWYLTLTALTNTGNSMIRSHDLEPNGKNGLILMLKNYLGEKSADGFHTMHR